MSWEYTKLKVLGKGAFGRVYEVEKDSKICAMKKIENEDYSREGFEFSALREVDVLYRMKHPHILNCHEVKVNKDRIYVFMERAKYDVYEWVHETEPDDVEQFKRFAYEILSGLIYLHSNRIIHGDIKPENVLITQKDHIKLADFGLMVHHYPGKKMPAKYYFTIWYRSPDMLCGNNRFDEAADMWAYGCILYIMLTGDYLFSDDRERDMVSTIIKKVGKPPKEFLKRYPKYNRDINSQIDKGKCYDLDRYKVRRGVANMMNDRELNEIFDLIKACLRYLPEDRITAEQAAKWPTFSRYYSEEKYPHPEPLSIPIPTDKKVQKFRLKMYDWYTDLSKKLKIRSDSTLILALNLLDRMYAKRPKLGDPLLTVLTCLLIAMKLNEESFKDPIKMILCNSKGSYTRKAIIKREKTIITTLNFHLYYPNLYTLNIGKKPLEEIIEHTVYGHQPALKKLKKN